MRRWRGFGAPPSPLLRHWSEDRWSARVVPQWLSSHATHGNPPDLDRKQRELEEQLIEEETARRVEEEIRSRVETAMASEGVQKVIHQRLKEERAKLEARVTEQLKREEAEMLDSAHAKRVRDRARERDTPGLACVVCPNSSRFGGASTCSPEHAWSRAWQQSCSENMRPAHREMACGCCWWRSRRGWVRWFDTPCSNSQRNNRVVKTV
jgi:hypothetical protein